MPPRCCNRAAVLLLLTVVRHQAKADAVPEGITYEGEKDAEGRPHGQGVLTRPDGVMYSGGFHRGLRHGQGNFTAGKGSYIGGYFEDRAHGYGVMIWPTGDMYEGNWRDGDRDGFGIFTSPDRRVGSYEGGWMDNMRHGQGRAT